MLGAVEAVTTILISETFGPTVQGEGPSTGRRAWFIRLGLCNLNCAWCDTPYTWDWKGETGTVYNRKDELTRYDVRDVAAQVLAQDVGLVVVTGGEPLVQRPALEVLLGLLGEVDVEVETNGTLPLGDVGDLARLNVSPKLPHSGVAPNLALTAHLQEYVDAPAAAFKFVARHWTDLDAIQQIVDRYGIKPWQVWVMPEGRTDHVLQARLREFADAAIRRGWNVSGRLQVTLWGDERKH